MASANNSLSTGNRVRKLSITKLLTLVLSIILIIFISFAYIAYSRLTEFHAMLADVENELLPSIVSSNKTYDEIAMLVYLTESLSKSTNETERTRSFIKIKDKLKTLKNNVELHQKTPYLSTQLSILEVEITELNQLIQQKLKLENNYNHNLQKLFYLSRQAITSNDNKQSNNQWQTAFINIATDVAILDNINNLAKARQLIANITLALSKLNQPNTQHTKQQYHAQLSDLLLGKSGILSSKTELILARSRTLGRGNFVRNLLLDYANGADFQSYKTNKNITEKIAASLTKVNNNINTTIILATTLVLFLLALIIFIHFKLTIKLKALYLHVKSSLSENDYPYSPGKDEIDDVYNIFNLFVKNTEQQRHVLKEISLTDSLTNIPNRRAFDEKLEEYFHLARRENWPISIFMIDVDYFKHYNDLYGHIKGDDCLIEIASILKNLMKRNADFVARFGGEEFACILLNHSAEKAEKLAKQIITAMSEHKITHENSSVANYITLSIGCVTYHASSKATVTVSELLQQADKALYLAKSKGRNGFECSTIN